VQRDGSSLRRPLLQRHKDGPPKIFCSSNPPTTPPSIRRDGELSYVNTIARHCNLIDVREGGRIHGNKASGLLRPTSRPDLIRTPVSAKQGTTLISIYYLVYSIFIYFINYGNYVLKIYFFLLHRRIKHAYPPLVSTSWPRRFWCRASRLGLHVPPITLPCLPRGIMSADIHYCSPTTSA
jgi:hypothetical protein